MAESVSSESFITRINLTSSQDNTSTTAEYNGSTVNILEDDGVGYLNSDKNPSIRQRLDFSNSEIIGKGTASFNVKSAILKNLDGKTRAVVCKSMYYGRTAIDEIQALRKLQGKKNIIQILGAYTYNKNCNIVLELGHIDMLRYTYGISDLPRSLPMNEISGIARDMYSAISSCKEANIYHDDIHLGNWIVVYTEEDSQAQGTVKLADFGLSEYCEDKKNCMLRDTTNKCLDKVISSNSYKSKLPNSCSISDSVKQLTDKDFSTKDATNCTEDEIDFDVYLQKYEVELAKYLNGEVQLAKILTPLFIKYSHTKDNPFKDITILNIAEIITAIEANCEPKPLRYLPIRA